MLYTVNMIDKDKIKYKIIAFSYIFNATNLVPSEPLMINIGKKKCATPTSTFSGDSIDSLYYISIFYDFYNKINIEIYLDPPFKNGVNFGYFSMIYKLL